MADFDCNACENIKSTAPNLVVNGLTNTECASLKNNTGLSPSSGHNDCTDLDDLNDCLVGNMSAEVEAYDVCEWKPFMKKFIPNVWTTIKAVICAICGLWTNISTLRTEMDNIWSRMKALCDMINAQIGGNATHYGLYPRRTRPYGGSCGSIPTINGRPALIDLHVSGLDEYTGVGIDWGSVTGMNCSTGSEEVRRFWEPYVVGYGLNKDVSVGSPLWVATKSELQALIPTMTDEWWYQYTIESWTWTTGVISDGADRGKNIWLKFKVGDAGYSNNYLVLTYDGTSYPNAVPNYDAPINMSNQSEFRWM